MNKPNRAFPKGIVAYVRYDKGFTFTHFMAHPKTGYWAVGSKWEFDSGELLTELKELLRSNCKEAIDWDVTWSKKLEQLLNRDTRFIAR